MIDLNSVPTGACVIKPDATPFDFAFHRTGTVIREKVGGHIRLGIQWEGADSVFAYPEDTQVEIQREKKK